MNNARQRGWGVRWPIGLVVLFMTGGLAQAAPMKHFTGYTRIGHTQAAGVKAPGVEVAPHSAPHCGPFGVTVYFSVYDRTEGTPDDPWGTGLKGLDALFGPGKAGAGLAASRGLDRNARYLYLYQVINDSGVNADVNSASIRLLVEPQMITSWGHFAGMHMKELRGLGFGILVPVDPKNPQAGTTARALSSEAAAVIDAEYRCPAPHFLSTGPYALTHILVNNIRNKGLPGGMGDDVGRAPDSVVIATGVIFEGAPVRNAQGLLVGAVAGPEAVDALPLPGGVIGRPMGVEPLPLPGGVVGRPFAVPGILGAPPVVAPPVAVLTGLNTACQAFWLENPIRPGERSVVFGFTSDVGPGYGDVRVQGSSIGVAEAAAAVAFTCYGTVPIPIVVIREEVIVEDVIGTTTLIGSIGGLGGVSIGGGGIPIGGVGGGVSLGGGAGLGSGGGGGDGEGEGDATAIPTQEQAQSTGTTTNITNFATSNANANADSHAHAHAHVRNDVDVNNKVRNEGDRDRDRDRKKDVDKIIPEPAAVITAVLGLPALLAVARRRRKQQNAE